MFISNVLLRSALSSYFRKALPLLVVAPAVMMFCVGSKLTAQDLGKPNIVLILTDDQTRSTLRHMPELQSRLVGHGRIMDEMVSTYPLCCPGRTTILRGQYAHNHRVLGNNRPYGGWDRFRKYGLHRNNVGTWLHRASYRTGYFGKFINQYDGTGIPPGWDRWYAQYGKNNGVGRVNDQGQIHDVKGHADSDTSEKALGWISASVQDTSPVFAVVGFNAPHAPGRYAPEDGDRFTAARVPRTLNFDEKNVRDKPEWIRRKSRVSLNEARRMDTLYRDQLRSLQTVDRFVRDLDDALGSELGNTYVFYYTDNGLHLGNHRLNYGKLTPYEEDINFPLIVRGPGVPSGSESQAIIGDHDIAVTIGRIAGANVPDYVDGRSALPILKGTAPASWRTGLYIEKELKPGSEPPNDPDIQPDWEGIRTNWRTYSELETGEKELYDLQGDPQQLKNIYSSASQNLRRNLHRRVERLSNCDRNACRRAEDG